MPGRRPVVFFIDDDLDALEMYQMGLSNDGFLPVITRDALSAASQADAIRPDIVVTGMHLQGATGLNVIEALKRAAPVSGIPVVLLTGYSDPTIDRRAHELGCAAILMKPCTPDELGQVLRQVLTTS
jgi:DNA-binding NtrC family response regulator